MTATIAGASTWLRASRSTPIWESRSRALRRSCRLRSSKFEDTYLFIISDHGIKPLREFEEARRLYHSAHDHGGDTPIIAKHDFEDGDDVPGIFLAMGPSTKRDLRLMGFTVGVFDIAPTILKLFGIPQPTQMKGAF